VIPITRNISIRKQNYRQASMRLLASSNEQAHLGAAKTGKPSFEEEWQGSLQA
jgi:hypothetical protein